MNLFEDIGKFVVKILSKGSFVRTFALFYLLIIGSYVFFQFYNKEGDSSVKDGDYSAFYVAGEIAREAPGLLYNLNLQAKKQTIISNEDAFHVFAYPPFFSFIFITLSILPFYLSKLIYLIIGLILCFYSAKFLKIKYFPDFSNATIFSLMFLFFPLLIGVVGGQNTAISLILLLLIEKFYISRNYYLLGIFAALFSFKPQYGFFVFLYLLIIEREKLGFLLYYLFTLTILLLSSYFYFGIDIFSSWIALLIELSSLNQSNIENLSKMVSLLGALKLLEVGYGIFGFYLGLIFVTTLLSLVAFKIYRRIDSAQLILYLGPIIVFISPQTGFYDSALILPFVFSNISKLGDKFFTIYLTFIFLLSIFFLLQTKYSLPFFSFYLFVTIYYLIKRDLD